MPHRLPTREVRIGALTIGGQHPIAIQTMTTTDTLDIAATVAQSIRCIEAGAQLVRITAPSKREAEALAEIRSQICAAGYDTPLVADIHFTPNAAEIAARIVEKVRVNPGNYVDKKKFDQIEYTDTEYAAEIDRIRERFTPLVRICKEHGTAMRIGTNHGSLSDRIMSRYGDTALGMVESAMEFLRIARAEDYHQIVLSMKSSNPMVMVEAYRTLVQHMQDEFGECYPLHLGVTEAGDGEDGRIKSAIGIGTLLEEGIGDTIRVSLTEDPEAELPVCKDIIEVISRESLIVTPNPGVMLEVRSPSATEAHGDEGQMLNWSRIAPHVEKRVSIAVENIGGSNVPVVVADFMHTKSIAREDLAAIGYRYDAVSDKWNIGDAAADYIFLGNKTLDFELPGTLKPVVYGAFWMSLGLEIRDRYIPVFEPDDYLEKNRLERHPTLNFIDFDIYWDDHDTSYLQAFIDHFSHDQTVVLCLYDTILLPADSIRRFIKKRTAQGLACPVIICDRSRSTTVDEQLIEFSVTSGTLLLDGIGDGVWLMNDPEKMQNAQSSGRTYLEVANNYQFLNNTAFSILQATRRRISKTEYISCPSCGRTLFDLQETTAKIRAVTHHLKGVKIAIMGCIVNGPGEMADADFGYVGSGPGKITLYRSKEVVKRNVPSEVAVEELIELLKESGAWVETAAMA